MYSKVNLSEDIYWLGVNDRRTHLFENLYPIENGVAYNSYLIVDEKVALVDTVEISKADDYLEKIKSILGERKIDYLIVNHMEPDHSGAIKDIVREYPEITIVGNKRTFGMLQCYYGMCTNQHVVENGSVLNLGKHELKFFLTPWLHWPETMMTFETTNGILFSGDAFGSFGTLDGGIFDDEVNLRFYEDEMLRYYANIVGKYSNMVPKAFAKLKDIDIKMIAATHGPIWRTDLGKVLKFYQDWSTHETEKGVVIVFGTMYGNTEKMADAIARRVAENGIKNIRVYDASKTHHSYIIRDIWKYKGVILGSCAYNSTLFPSMKYLVDKIEHLAPKNHLLGIFGSYTWNGGGVKTLNSFAENIGWEVISNSVETKGIPQATSFKECTEMADKMAQRINEIFE